MRIARASLGQISQTTCAAAGGNWNATTSTCVTQAPIGAPGTPLGPTPPPAQPAAPTTPVGYNAQTGAVSPANVTGETISGLATTSQGLCVQEGGEWNDTSQTCNFNALCTQFPFGGVFNQSTGQCSYLNFYLTLGGVALFAFVLIAMARK